MAQTRPNRKMDTREARRKMEAQAEPHWLRLAPAEALGYHKPKDGAAGTWRARLYLADTRTFRKKALGTADDFTDADGELVLTYAQAQRKARAWFDEARCEATGERVHRGPVTVAQVMTAYLAHMEREGRRSAKGDRQRADLRILPALGALAVEKLTRLRLEKWRDDLAASAPLPRGRVKLRPEPKRPRKVKPEKPVPKPPKTAEETLPVLHQTCKGEEAALDRVEEVGLLGLALDLPLVEAGGGHQAALPLEGRAEGGLLDQGLGPRVDGFREGRRILHPAGDQAPEGHLGHSLVPLWPDDDDVLARGDVVAVTNGVARWHHAESLGQGLGRELEHIAPAHGPQGNAVR